MNWSVVLASVSALVACSQGGITGKAKPQGILEAVLEQAPENTCIAPGSTRTIGSFGVGDDARPVPIEDGTSATNVVCKVSELGDGRSAVHGELKVNGERYFLLDGVLPAQYDRVAFPDGITLGDIRMTVSGVGPDGTPVVYGQSSGCVLKYLSDAEGTAGGRAWGELRCPTAQRGEIGAGDPSSVCTLRARFRFENCGFGADPKSQE